jgi:hypothetical protein
MKFNDRKQIGFIAQEINKVLPEVVNTDAKGYYRVNYSMLIPVLTEAIKEQQATIDQLKAENSSVKSDVDKLKAEIEIIKDATGIGKLGQK